MDFNYTYAYVHKLDEAKEFMSPALFKGFDTGFHTYTADYISLHVRNLQKPILEIWNFSIKFAFINGTLNSMQNPSLFSKTIEEVIFKKYRIQAPFNRLVTK